MSRNKSDTSRLRNAPYDMQHELESHKPRRERYEGKSVDPKRTRDEEQSGDSN